MKVSGGVLAAHVFGGPFVSKIKAAEEAIVDIDTKSFFKWQDPEVLRLTEEVFQKCILGKVRIDKAVEAVRKYMLDEKAGVFLSVNRDTLEKIPVATIGSWTPLHAGIPTEAQAKRMAEVFQTPSWQTPLPIPTADQNDRRFRPDGFWRGDVWPATNYQVAGGLAAYGYKNIAADIADKTVTNAIKNGISENYNAISGKATGVDFLGMTCTVLTMMLDGLCKKHMLEMRKI
jgi:hypothetical protein